MVEFSLSISLSKKERVDPGALSTPVDRGFISRSLVALAEEIQGREKTACGAIRDDTGIEVGSWKFSLSKREG